MIRHNIFTNSLVNNPFSLIFTQGSLFCDFQFYEKYSNTWLNIAHYNPHDFIMTKLFSLLLFSVICFGAFTYSSAQTDTDLVTNISPSTGTFVKKRYSVKGEWELVTVAGKQTIRFSEDFKTKNGPDLKVYLSPQSLSEVTRKTATDRSVKIGVLKSSTGEQSYIIPEGVSLADYKSVLVHCEAYSVLWGGFDIPQ